MANEFLLATGKQYDSMRSRFKAKYDEDGNLKKVGREVPFTKDEYRAWVRAEMEKGLACAYCARPLALVGTRATAAMQPDHDVPVKRGGGLGLSNIVPACPLCNTRKGELTGAEFRSFVAGLKTFPEAARGYIYKQMSMRPVFRPHVGPGGPKPRPKLTTRKPEAKAPAQPTFFEESF